MVLSMLIRTTLRLVYVTYIQWSASTYIISSDIPPIWRYNGNAVLIVLDFLYAQHPQENCVLRLVSLITGVRHSACPFSNAENSSFSCLNSVFSDLSLRPDVYLLIQPHSGRTYGGTGNMDKRALWTSFYSNACRITHLHINSARTPHMPCLVAARAILSFSTSAYNLKPTTRVGRGQITGGQRYLCWSRFHCG